MNTKTTLLKIGLIIFLLFTQARIEHFEDGSGRIDIVGAKTSYCLPFSICNK